MRPPASFPECRFVLRHRGPASLLQTVGHESAVRADRQCARHESGTQSAAAAGQASDWPWSCTGAEERYAWVVSPRLLSRAVMASISNPAGCAGCRSPYSEVAVRSDGMLQGGPSPRSPESEALNSLRSGRGEGPQSDRDPNRTAVSVAAPGFEPAWALDWEARAAHIDRSSRSSAGVFSFGNGI